MTLKNTENDAIITIKTLQSDGNSDEEMELITEGKFYKSKDKFYILYTENGTDKSLPRKVMIIIEVSGVRMIRKGPFATQMNYVVGKTIETIYHTPYGDFMLLITTIRIDNSIDENGGVLKLIYRLSIAGEEFYNDVTIRVKNGKGD